MKLRAEKLVFQYKKILLGKTNEKRTEFQKSSGENFESKTISFPIQKILLGKTNEIRIEFQNSYKVGWGKNVGFGTGRKKTCQWIDE